MAWLNSIFVGSTAANLIAITVGLVLVLLGLFWVFRKIAGNNSIRGTKNRRPRLGVTEAAIVDDKRRLVLVRRDNVEHLVMIGGASDVLVESNIVRVQPATSHVEPIKAAIILDEDEISEQLDSTDIHDDVPPRGVSALASGAAATAAVVASVESALSKSGGVSASAKLADAGTADAGEDSEFTAAVADTLAGKPMIEDARFGDSKSADTGSIANGIIKAETKVFEAAGSTSVMFKKPTDAFVSKVESKADVSVDKAVPAANETPDIKLENTHKEDKPSEAEDVEIKIESISNPDEVAEKTPSETSKEEPKAPEVAPPFEVAAAVSHQEPENRSDTKTKSSRSDDMEDEMQKLLSELAGERRG